MCQVGTRLIMSEGIVCKVWNIKGQVKQKTTKSQLSDSLSYILDDDKTSVEIDVDNESMLDPEGQLDRECKYIKNDIKTFNGALTGTHNLCSVNTKDAVSEMMETKEFYHKKGGRSALHLMISLPEEESDISNASKLMQLANDVLKELFPDNQAVYAIHTNTDNLHAHIIVNSVGLNGKKIHQPKNFMKKVMQPCINKYAEKYGFKKNEKWEKTDNTNYKYIDKKIYLRECIDRAIENSNTFDDFIKELKIMGISTKVGKYLTISTEDMKKPIRSFRLGTNYSIESIVERISNRLAKFEVPDVEQITYGKEIDKVLSPNTVPLRKYKSLRPEEKKKVIKLLKVGRNPWRENQQANWQLNNIANELNIEYRLSEYKKFYSVDGSVEGTLEGIKSTQETLSDIKKQLRKALRVNKPVIDIYKRMKEIERKAYLFEHCNKEEFKREFYEYRSLTHRLERGYNKNIFEVADFISEFEDRLLYCNGQLKELSEEYKEVYKYALKHGHKIKREYSLVDAVGAYENYKQEKNGLFDMDMYYISSKNSDVVARVEKTPGVDSRGNVIEKYKVVFLSKYGEELSTIDNIDNKNQLNNKLKEMGTFYDFKNDCRRFNSLYMAKDYAGLSRNKEEKKPRANLAQGEKRNKKSFSKHIKTYSFSSAINLNSIRGNNGSHYVMNAQNPIYFGSLLTNDEYIRFTVFNREGAIEEIFNIPSFHKRTYEGYKAIQTLKNKYGFSDELVSFNEQPEAYAYYSKYEDKDTRVVEEEKRNIKDK